MAASTRFIIDASYVLSFLLSDEKNKEVEETFDKFATGQIKFFAPYLLHFEVLNGLNTAAARKRIDSDTAQEMIKHFLELEIATINIDLVNTFKLAQIEGLSFYDAAYIYLAKQQNLNFLTLDKKLQAM